MELKTTQFPITNSLEWATENFSGVFCTDVRRTRRIINFAAKMKDSPGKSIPQLWNRPYDVKATYNMLQHPESTPDFLQRGHRKLVMNTLSQPGTYLLIEDDCEFSWSYKEAIKGLGPIGAPSSKSANTVVSQYKKLW